MSWPRSALAIVLISCGAISGVRTACHQLKARQPCRADRWELDLSPDSAQLHCLVCLIPPTDPTNVWYVSTYRVQVKEGSDAQLPCLITNPAYGSNVTLLMDNHSPILPGTEFSFSAQDGVTIYRVQQAQKGYYRCQVLINGEAKKSARIRLLVSEGEGLGFWLLFQPLHEKW